MDIFVPLWLMFQEMPLIHFMVIVSKSEDSAIRLLSDIQAELEYNKRLIADFGEQKNNGSWLLIAYGFVYFILDITGIA